MGRKLTYSWLVNRVALNFRKFFALWWILSVTAGGHAAVFQFATGVSSPAGKPGKAFMWIPPGTDHIRGVLIGGQTVFEDAFTADAKIREACALEDLAIVQFIPSLDALFDYKHNDCAARLEQALVELGKVSNHPELGVAPLFPFGHSVSSLFACRVVCWAPQRCFGALSFKGGMDVSYDPKYAGVPFLVIKGQFEEFGPGPSGILRDKLGENRETSWKDMRETLLEMRAADDRNLVSLLVDPGAGHFSWSASSAPVVAMFIRKAAECRIPKQSMAATQPAQCNEIDPKTGTLSDADVEHPSVLPGNYSHFRGNPNRAFWNFDAEMASAMAAVEAGQFDKEPQFIQFLSAAGKPLDVPENMWMDLPLVWSGPDTITYRASFADSPTRRYPPMDKKAGHSDGGIKFRALAGAVEQLSPTTFRISPDGRDQMRVYVAAYNEGDRRYRYAEQMSRIKIPATLTKGAVQTITFDPIGEMTGSSAPIRLKATSNLGLPVHFYVEYGPAEIDDGDMLRVADLPVSSKAPLTIAVVAYQWGSAIAPFVQTAVVRQEITIKP